MSDKQRLFITPGQELYELGNGLRGVYSAGTLRIYLRDEQIFNEEAEAWEGFEIISSPKGRHVTPMTPPRKDEEVIMWLLGLGKLRRSQDEKGYKEILSNFEAKNRTTKYEKKEFKGEHFALMQCNIDGSWGNIAAWVSPEISKDEIIELKQYMTAYPIGYTEKVLRNRLGIA